MLDIQPSPKSPRYAFGRDDRVTIGGISYRPIDESDNGFVFVRLDGQGVAESFSRTEIARLVERGQLEHARDALLPEQARARLARPGDLLSALPPGQHHRTRRKLAAVLAFLDLELEGKVVRTDASILAAMDALLGRAARVLAGSSRFDDGEATGTAVLPRCAPRTLRRWLVAYEARGLPGLYDAVDRRGNSARRLCPESLSLLGRCVNGFMSPLRPTQSAIFMDVKIAFDTENRQRRATGRPELPRPSRETVRQAILALDPYQCDFVREGSEAARKKHAPIGTGLVLTRPLQRVEIDTWKIDLLSILAETGVLLCLSDEDRKRLGLTGQKKRWHLTVALCATTRCILGMRLSRTPTADTTVQVIEMITRDKGVWADAVGALSPWNMCGTPELIVTDLGSEYIAYDVTVAATDIGTALDHAPGGLPEMRARIERMFRTMSVDLMQRLTGRTFGSALARGDYDAKGRAALTAEDLCSALIRWVVDIYHRKPHEGLGGESPARCWDRLTEIYGVAPAADLRRRRLAFGLRTTRTLQKDGLTVFGVRYHSAHLAERALRQRERKLNVRWYSEDLGAIAVEIDGEWVEVPSVFANFRGMRAEVWNATQYELAARFKNEVALDEEVVLQAIRNTEATNGAAMRRLGLLADHWTEAQLLQAEERMLSIGFNVEPDAGNATPQDQGWLGDELATAVAFPHINENAPVRTESPLPAAQRASHAVPDHARRDPGDDDPGFQIEDRI